MLDNPELTGVQPENLDADVPAEKQDTPAEKTFTQAEVDRILRERLRRERDGQETLREKAKRWEEFEQSQKSDLEIAREQNAQLAARVEQIEAQYRDSVIQREVVAAATSRGFLNPNDALLLARNYGQMNLDDEGNPSGIKEAVEALAKDKPYLLRNTPAASSKLGATNPATQTPDSLGQDWSHLFVTSGKSPFGSKG